MDLMKLPLAARNAAFDALPLHEQAIAVAKDVINQLDDHKYLAETGNYVFYTGSRLDLPQSFQEVLETTQSRCEVCALGGMFVSTARLRNRISTQQALMNVSDVMVHAIEDIFPEKELRAIEFVFEGYNASHYDFTYEETNALVNYAEVVRGGVLKELPWPDRKGVHMRRIMQNIIDNDGTFNVPGVELDKK
jgi:hypothetical protein